MWLTSKHRGFDGDGEGLKLKIISQEEGDVIDGLTPHFLCNSTQPAASQFLAKPRSFNHRNFPLSGASRSQIPTYQTTPPPTFAKMSAVDYLLLEASVGYGLFQVVEQPDTIGSRLKEVQEAANDLGRFKQMVKLVSFAPFQFVVLSPQESNPDR